MFAELLDRLFKRTKESSGSVAKDRLKMVLSVDRTDMAPQTMEEMRKEILAVITKYFEIDDTESLEVGLEREQGSTAIIANIPIRRVKAADA